MFTSSIFISFGTKLIQSIVSFISGHVPFYIGSIANGIYSCILYSKLYTNICPLILQLFLVLGANMAQVLNTSCIDIPPNINLQ